MKRIILILLLFVSLAAYSQDVIILRNGDTVNCIITKIDSASVYCDLQKGERRLSSFFAISEVRSYKVNSTDNGIVKDGIFTPGGIY